VTLAVDNSSNEVDETLTVQATDGLATFADLSLNIAGSNTLQATDGSLTSATSSSFSIAPAAAAQLVFLQQPSDGATNSIISPAVVVAVEDQFGNTVTSGSPNVTVAVVRGPSATLNGTVTESAVDGIAIFSNLSLNAGGDFVVEATDGTIAADSASFSITVAPAPVGSSANHLAFVQEPETLIAGAATPSAFVVDVEDLTGDFVTSSTSRMTLTILSGPKGATLHGTTTVVTNDGVAAFSNVYLDVAGDYTFQVKDGRLTTAISDSVVVDPAAPVKLVFVQQPSNATAGNAIDPPVVVELKDRFNNIATNDDAAVTLSITFSPAGAVAAGDATVTPTNGLATFNDILLDTAGRYRLTASEGTLTVKSKTITIIPAIAANVIFAQQSAEVIAGHLLASPIKISVTDAFGNPVANGTVVTLAISGAPNGGTIFGKTTAVTHNGIAEFANVTFHIAGDYTLTATTGSVAAQSTAITVSPAAASRMVFLQAPADPAPNTPFNVQIKLLDPYGNVATNISSPITVALGTHPANALLTGPNTATVLDGVATFSGLTLNSTGTYTLRFKDDDLQLVSRSFDATDSGGG
jgi:hypothetical protein